MIEIPPGATPADVVGETDILPGQDWLIKAELIRFANQMADGSFAWDAAQEVQPMMMQEGINGRVISQGHHRWVAARLAQVEIPVTIEIRRDYWPGPVPFAWTWDRMVWIDEEDQQAHR